MKLLFRSFHGLVDVHQSWRTNNHTGHFKQRILVDMGKILGNVIGVFMRLFQTNNINKCISSLLSEIKNLTAKKI